MLRSFNGKSPKIHPTAFVSEAAYLVGDVEVGEHSSIWPGVVIRADNGKITIGASTNVQDNAVVHADHSATIGDHVTLGHGVVCHAARVGDHALLGNGCVVNEGATIGRYALVAANSVVLEGADVADETVVAGAPARVRGQIAKRHREMMDDTWRHYVAKAADFKREGGLE